LTVSPHAVIGRLPTAASGASCEELAPDIVILDIAMRS